MKTKSSLHAILGKCGKPDLFYEDHGILTLFITINMGGSCQGFGGYVLDRHDKQTGKREGSAAGMDFIVRLLDLFEVRRLEEIEGRPIYALYEDDQYGRPIIGLRTPEFDGNKEFLISDWQKKWLHK